MGAGVGRPGPGRRLRPHVPREDMPGVDLVIPDISYLLRKDKRSSASSSPTATRTTSAASLRPQAAQRAPSTGRASPGLVKRQAEGAPHPARGRPARGAEGDRFQLGAVRVELFRVCHSIPDAGGLAIQTPAGTVVHTGDFKLDHTRRMGSRPTSPGWRRSGDEGVLLLLSDSTNAEREGHSGSERDLIEPFERIFRDAPSRIVVASFASNIHRIQQLINAGGGVRAPDRRSPAEASRPTSRRPRSSASCAFHRA